MTERSEALAQLSRLLGDDSLRSASSDEARQVLRREFSRLLNGLVEEAEQSDDVFDPDSAFLYIERRLGALSDLVDDDLRQRLKIAARERIEKW